VCSARYFLNFSEPRVYSARVFPARLSIDTLYRSVSSAVNNASASIIYDIPVDNQTATETRRVGSHGRAGTPLPAESRLPGNVAGHPDTKHPYLMSSLSILPARSWPRRKFPLPSPYCPSLHPRALSAPLYSLYRRHSRQAAALFDTARARSLSPPRDAFPRDAILRDVGTLWN